MSEKTVAVKLAGKSKNYQITISNDVLKECGTWAKDCLSVEPGRITIFSNEKVFGLYGEKVRQSLENTGFKTSVWLMQDGEEYKNFTSLQDSLNFLSESKIKRSDAVIALGGGVVGDLAGFASSVYLRGIDFLQIPTTLLAMIDSSVGGKTAVNTNFGKNLIGSFYQPAGVLIDVNVLKTLEQREVVAGFCEAIKQGAIGSRELVDVTHNFLNNYEINNFHQSFESTSFLADLKNLLKMQISFKADIVMNDEQESTVRSDSKSRKILNFGHTTAHALEKITDYNYFRHGEAVGYGILVAAEISKKLEICDGNSIKLLNNVVALLGELPDANNIDLDQLYDLFVYDKKAIGQTVQWILLEGIGKPKIISQNDIPESIIKSSLQQILHN